MKSEAIGAFLDESLHQTARRLAQYSQEIAAFPPPPDDAQARQQARELLTHMGQAGWLRAFHPPPGQILEARAICLTREALAAVSPLADDIFAVQGLATQPLVQEGSQALRERWLEGAVEGRFMGAFAMTEPEAGSDVASISTTARAAGEEYLLNGCKTLISNAGLADFYIVFASLDRNLGSRGIGAFLVEAGEPGLHFAGPQILSAPHPLGGLDFHDCRAHLLCREGFKLGMKTLDALRVSVAASACGMAGRALHEATQRALGRRQFGQALAEFQMIQSKLADMAIRLDAARLLTYRAAWQRDRGDLRNSREVAMAKAFATESAQLIIDSALQILGGQGLLANHPVEHLYRAIRALRIYEGTTEIQHLIIAKDLLKGAQA